MAIPRSAAVTLLVVALGASLGVGVLANRERWAPEVRQYRTGLAEHARELTGQPESVSDGAVQQRFQARRAAVAAMKADLRRLVAAESAVVADTGFPLPQLPPRYWTGPSRGNVGPFITMTRNGWWATMSHTVTAIHCAVAVGGDTTFGTAKSGEPVCFGEKDWTAVQ
jgi:hypothetical protein